VVAPLRVARGVQNKVLEAMAMAKPVAATSMALEGISYGAGSGIRVCDTVQSWIDELTALLGDETLNRSEPGARQHVTKMFSWEASSRSLAKVVIGA
jgi:glycosyltransferase involved in cell wall biosynthesis